MRVPSSRSRFPSTTQAIAEDVMAISITIDNDAGTPGTQTLINDQSAGTQTPATIADTGNDSNVDVSDATVPSGATPDSNLFDGTLSGANYSAAFLSFLNGATVFGSGGLKLNDTQKPLAANVHRAVRSSCFVPPTATPRPARGCSLPTCWPAWRASWCRRSRHPRVRRRCAGPRP